MGPGQRTLIEANGAQLAGARWGTGSPAVVFLPDGVCDRRFGEAVIADLPELGTKVAYDMRGYGESRADPGSCSHLEDLLEVLQ
ncbi:MAG TPA: alpha/beta hydrolase [Candidatus Acidoferrales bacterium]|nr:alpha/beta hydrolase [Candidatus Acidoferrales bacterium]